MALRNKLAHAWNAFRSAEEEEETHIMPFSGHGGGESFGLRPDRSRHRITNDRSILSSLYTRLAIDVAAVDIKHVRLDDQDNYSDTIKSGLNKCLSLEANLDQAARAFRQDVAMSLFDKGVIAIVPVDTTFDPRETSFDVKSLRVGEIVSWQPRKVRVNLYDDRTGQRRELLLPKSSVAIVENPLSMVMNEPNSTLARLTRKLSLLDTIDEQAGSGKLDLIIQLPYVIKTEQKRAEAEKRRKDIELQMSGSRYGIAYTDGTEKVTQLNRPAENNMLAQVEYLTELLYSQLGLTKEIFDGTADERTMINYYARTIEPIMTAITEAMTRTFLTETARTQKQSIMFFRDPFKLVAIGDMAEIADKFTRNEVMTSNEMRSKIAMKPSKDPAADELRNSNIPAPVTAAPVETVAPPPIPTP